MTIKLKAFTFGFCLLYLVAAFGQSVAADAAVIEEKPAAEKEEEAPEAKEEASESGETDDSAEQDPKKAEEEEAAVALPLLSDPVQVYGWREWVVISDGKIEERMQAKLDTGALTSSIHAEEKELFERDGKKWVRFIVTDPGEDDAKKLRIEAPLVRIAMIKEPGGESQPREVVRLGFKIGDRTLKAEFTLNNRSNMLSPLLIGRRTIKELGWVDSSRAYLADKKVMR